MSKYLKATLALALVMVVAVLVVPKPLLQAASVTGEQVLLKFKFLDDGISANGAGVQQVGEESTVSAAVASATMARVATAPASGSLYLRGIWIEKATTSTGAITVSYGTGTNCGTGTTTILAIAAAASQTIAVGEYKIGTQVPAGKDLCLTTDAATTSVRAFYN